MPPTHIFISHSSRDAAAAETICSGLEEVGIDCWISPRNIDPGQEYGAEIIRGIRGSSVLILLLTAYSNASQHVHKEVERATSYSVPVVVVRLEAVELAESLEYFLSDHHWLDAFARDSHDVIVAMASALVELGAGRPEGAASLREAVPEGTAQVAPPVGVLHLSELDLGSPDRYPNEARLHESVNALIEDILGLQDRHEFALRGIVVTGDVAHQAAPADYEQASRFFEHLSRGTGVALGNIAVVPGDRDANALLCEAARLRAEALSDCADTGCLEKFAPLRKLLTRMYGSMPLAEDLSGVHDWEGCPFLLVALNSACESTGSDGSPPGRVGLAQARRTLALAVERDPHREKLWVAVVHHNFLGRSHGSTENLSHADDVLALLAHDEVDLVLHGHRHSSGIEQAFAQGGERALWVAGSGGASRGGRGDEAADHYNVLVLRGPHRVEFISRACMGRGSGPGGARWVADTSVSADGCVVVPLSSAERERRPSRLMGAPDGLVGREHQLTQLAGIYDRILSGSAATLFVEGDLGIGKTTLVSTFCSQHDAEARFAWGRCPVISQNAPETVPMHGVRQLVCRLLGLPPREAALDDGAVVQALASFRVEPATVATLSLWLSGQPSAQPEFANAGKARAEVFASLAALFFACAEDAPLLLLLDDIQWADQSSLAFIERWVDHALDAPARVLLVCNFRPEGRAYNPSLRRTLGILARFSNDVVFNQQLTALTSEQASQVLRTALPAIRDEQIASVYETACGNPFLTLELGRYLVDRQSDGAVAPGAIPDSLRAVFENRLGDLHQAPDTENLATLLWALCVFDGDATVQELVAALPEDCSESGDAIIERLRVIGLVSLEGTGADRRARFTSRILLDVLPTEMAGFDVDGAAVLERIASALRGPLLGVHAAGFRARVFAEAGAFRDAAREYEVAALGSIEVGDAHAAAALVQRGLAALSREPHCDETSEARARLLIAQATVADRNGDYSGARQTAEDAMRAAISEQSRLRARLIGGMVLTRTGGWERGLEEFAELEQQQDGLSEELRVLVELTHASASYVRCRDIPAALVRLEAAAARARRIGADALAGRVLAHLGIFSDETGALSAARQYFRLAERHFRKAGAVVDLGLLEISLGNLAFDQGDLAASHEHLDRAIATLDAEQYRFGQANALLNSGMVSCVAGSVADGLQRCRHAEEMFTELGLEHGAAQCLFGVALGMSLGGADAETLEVIDDALALMRFSGTEDVRDLGVAECMRGFALSRLGERDVALASYSRGVQHFITCLDALRLVAAASNMSALGGEPPLPLSDDDSTPDCGAALPAEWRARVAGLWSPRAVGTEVRPVVRLKPNA